jgi:hypothetical protein
MKTKSLAWDTGVQGATKDKNLIEQDSQSKTYEFSASESTHTNTSPKSQSLGLIFKLWN